MFCVSACAERLSWLCICGHQSLGLEILYGESFLWKYIVSVFFSILNVFRIPPARISHKVENYLLNRAVTLRMFLDKTVFQYFAGERFVFFF
jgi:hypothetical protein